MLPTELTPTKQRERKPKSKQKQSGTITEIYLIIQKIIMDKQRNETMECSAYIFGFHKKTSQ